LDALEMLHAKGVRRVCLLKRFDRRHQFEASSTGIQQEWVNVTCKTPGEHWKNESDSCNKAEQPSFGSWRELGRISCFDLRAGQKPELSVGCNLEP